MQLVQPSKFFSVTIFRTRSTGSIGMRARTWAMLLFLVMLKNFRCLYSHYGSCMPSSPKEYISPCIRIAGNKSSDYYFGTFY